MRRRFIARVYRIPFLLSLSTLFTLSCSNNRPLVSLSPVSNPMASPLPMLQRTRPEELLPALVAEAERRVDLNMDQPMLWRRIAQIHLALGGPQKARNALLKAAEIAEDSTTRSLIADSLLAQRQPDAAKRAIGRYGYLGTNPTLMALSKHSQLTQTEQKRLEGPSVVQRGFGSGLQIFPTRLVMQLVLRGAEEETRKWLKPRLEFALQRGSEGGRTQSFHDAILCTFYLGDHANALKATDREIPYWRMQTLFCLLVGGATDAELILFADTRLSERDSDIRLTRRTPPSVRAEIVQRLRKVIPLVPLERPASASNTIEQVEDPTLGRIAMLCGILGEWELARLTAARIKDQSYRKMSLDAIQLRELPLFAPVQEAHGVSQLGALSQNLSRISRMSDSRQARRFLRQAIEEARRYHLSGSLADYAAQVAWQHDAPEMILLLIGDSSAAWFRCAQALKLARYYHVRGDQSRARAFLLEADRNNTLIAKRNQRALLGLDTAEEARRQGELALCDRWRLETHKLTGEITTGTIRTQVTLRLLRLDALRGDKSAYARSLVESRSLIQEMRRIFPAEADRLRIELSGRLMEARETAESLIVLQEVEAPSLQTHALCSFVEQALGLSLPPRTYILPDIMKDAARGAPGSASARPPR